MRLAGALACMLAAALPFWPPPAVAAEASFAMPPAAARPLFAQVDLPHLQLRSWPRWSRPSMSLPQVPKGVDGRDRPGHEREWGRSDLVEYRDSAKQSVVTVALTFQVSVCLDDFEYSIACRERSSLEAAHRLEQIFFDDFTTGIPAGTLRIWFAVKAEPSEQANFLREVEVRAVEAAYRKFKEKADQQTAAAGAANTPVTTVEAAQKFAQDIERWHNDAGGEARSGSNWTHEWGARSHSYKPGPALRDLAQIGSRNRDQNGSPLGTDLQLQASDWRRPGSALLVLAPTTLR
jgi:hypothetical protein